MDKDIFLALYKSFVRPHLEYASVIWSPTYIKDIVAIENVQRRATRMLPELKDQSYENRLKALGLPTLHYRRDRADILQLFKIMAGYESVKLQDLSIATNTTRGHKYKLEKHHAPNRFAQHRFSNRVVNSWNDLSSNTIESTSINIFKSNLNDNWKGKENKFHCEQIEKSSVR